MRESFVPMNLTAYRTRSASPILDFSFGQLQYLIRIPHSAIRNRSRYAGVPMFNELAASIWRRVPRKLRRWTVRVSHARFSVTAGAVVSDESGRVLLLKHRFRPGSGWGLPGGFIEKGEQPADALRRELREEIGMEISEPEVFAVRAFKEPKQIEIVFCCHAVGEAGTKNFEIQHAGWFELDGLPEALPKDQASLIRNAFADGARRHT